MNIKFNYQGEIYLLKEVRNNKKYYKITNLTNDLKNQKKVCTEILKGLGYWEQTYQNKQPYELGYILFTKVVASNNYETIDSILTNNSNEELRKSKTNNAPKKNKKPSYSYITSDRSSLSPREFYNKISELLKEKYKNLVWPNKTIDESNEKLERYFHLTDLSDEWIYKNKLNLNLNDSHNQRNYMFAQFIYHSGNKSASGLLNFFTNYNLYKNSFNEFDVDLFYNNCNNNPQLVKDNLKCVLSSNYKNFDIILNRYFELYKNIASYLNGHDKEYIINDLINNKNDTDPASVPNYLLSIIKRGNGFGLALACDYIKELDDKFNYLFKPDLHIMDFLDNYYGLSGTVTKNQALTLGSNMINDINSDSGEKVTGYKLDRMIYLLGSGNFFLDNFVENKKKASKYKWEVVLPQINNKK